MRATAEGVADREPVLDAHEDPQGRLERVAESLVGDLDDLHDVRVRARERGRMAAARGMGAVEGWLEAMQEQHVEELYEEALHQVTATTEAIAQEVRRQGTRPGGRELVQDIRSGARSVSEGGAGVWDDASEQARTAWVQTEHGVRRVGHQVQDAVHDAQERVKEGAEWVRDTTEEGVRQVRVRSNRLAEAGRRSVRLPGLWYDSISHAVDARMRGFTRSAGLMAAAGVVGLAAFIALTVGAVVGLNILLGAPWGALIVAVLYGIGAFALVKAAGNARREARAAAQREMDVARMATRDAVRPARQAFARQLEPKIENGW